jgi:hypothetical protein
LQVNCPSLPFHFLTANGTIVNLNTKQIMRDDVPSLPNPGASVSPQLMSHLAFAPETIFIGKGKVTSSAVDDLNNAIVFGHVLEILKHGEVN